MKFQTIVSLNQNRIAEDENSIITEYVTDSDDDREVSENETDEENEDDIENDFEEEDEEEEENEHTNYIEIDDPDYSNYEAEEEEVESLNDDEIDDDYENDEDDYNNDEQDYDNDEDDYEDDDDIDEDRVSFWKPPAVENGCWNSISIHFNALVDLTFLNLHLNSVCDHCVCTCIYTQTHLIIN